MLSFHPEGGTEDARTGKRVQDFAHIGKIKFIALTYVCVWKVEEKGEDACRIEHHLASSDLINHGNDAEPWLAMSTLCFNVHRFHRFNEHNSISVAR